jgi:hypothetical protein
MAHKLARPFALVCSSVALLPLLVSPLHAAAGGSGTLFAIAANQTLVKIDPSTGAFTTLADLNNSDNPQSFDLASDPVAHRLYAIRAFVTFGSDGFPIFHQSLLTVDSQTGAILAQPELTGTAFPTLLVDSSTGALMGFDGLTLVKIDPAVGTSKIVAKFAPFNSGFINSLALEQSSHTIYLSQEDSGPIESTTTKVFTINDQTGAIVAGPVLDRPVRQIALDSGNLYGVTDGFTFDYVAINKVTGATTLVTNIADNSSITQFGTATDEASHTTYVDVASQDPPGSFNFVDHLVAINDLTGATSSAVMPTGVAGNGMAFEPAIVITPDSAAADVTQAAASGAINNAGVANSLLSLLSNAASARSHGDCATAGNMYRAFSNLVDAQSGLHIEASTAGQLLIDARYLAANCP